MVKNEERSYKCGCIVGQKDSVLYLEYCPKHKAAPKLYEKLEQTTTLLNSLLLKYLLTGVRESLGRTIADNKKALAKAEGK